MDISELKNDLKNSVDEVISRMEEKNQCTTREESRNTQSDPEKKDRLKITTKQRFSNLWDYKKRSNIYVIGVLKKEGKKEQY